MHRRQDKSKSKRQRERERFRRVGAGLPYLLERERERERECKIPLYNLDSESNLDMRSILNPLNHTQSTLCATRQLSSLA